MYMFYKRGFQEKLKYKCIIFQSINYTYKFESSCSGCPILLFPGSFNKLCLPTCIWTVGFKYLDFFLCVIHILLVIVFQLVQLFVCDWLLKTRTDIWEQSQNESENTAVSQTELIAFQQDLSCLRKITKNFKSELSKVRYF